MNTTIVFVKAPDPGQVKTRLSPALSPQESAELYKAFVNDTLECAGSIEGAKMEVAYQASDQYPDLKWIHYPEPEFFPQNGQNLGEKLIYAFQKAFDEGASKAVVLGSDAPSMPVAYLEKAFDELKANDVVLGPAQDGGYYLIGLSRFIPDLFSHIPWSTPDVFNATMDHISRHSLSCHLLPMHADIDTVDDLKNLWESNFSNISHCTVSHTNAFLIKFFQQPKGNHG